MIALALALAVALALAACGAKANPQPVGDGSGTDTIAECSPGECGPALGMPSQQCSDGSIGGNTGRCVKEPDGSCGWEIRECPATETDCVATGCSCTVCAETTKDVVTTCEMKPEYQCYQGAECKVQPSGECGWTMDDRLTRCLASPPPM